jgi:hypothetical protein
VEYSKTPAGFLRTGRSELQGSHPSRMAYALGTGETPAEYYA